MNYTVSANGRTLEVIDDSETVMHHADPDVVYGEVQVSAINTWSGESACYHRHSCCRFVFKIH